MKRTLIFFAAAIFLAGMHFSLSRRARAAAVPAVTRPPIVGVAHIGLYVSDMARSREFYGHDLGFADAFSLDKPTGGLMLTYFKVNDHQYIELFPGLTSPTADRLSHVAFETTDARRLRAYLAAHGVEVPAELKKGLDGNLSFMVKDPDGHNVEFVEYLPGSGLEKDWGKDMPSTRIGTRIIHVGVTVGDRAAADKFYKDILGFRLIWQGGMTDQRTDWVDMQVPNGTDWLEYMLNVRNPTPRTLGVMHHFSIGIKNHEVAYQEVLERGYKPPEPPKIGRDGKWQLNLYDPDLTRAEVMEFKPVEPPCCSPMILGPGDVLQPAPPSKQ
jgi:catechol 2,3-dioxygenase-like lactoylglutathione lyase family enzyme